MQDTKLKTAVLGLNDDGLLLLQAAKNLKCFDVVAVADKDSELVEETAKEYGCGAYDDYRQLIIQNQFDCLLIAAGLYSCDEHIRTAIKNNSNVLKLAPLARNLEEAIELVRLAEQQKVKFAVANPCRFAESFLAFKKTIQENGPQQFFLITAFCGLKGKDFPAWHNDPKLSGGGVLLRNCYQIIDQIIENFGLPEQIYSLNTNTAASDKQQRHYLTEDTVLLSIRSNEAQFANLTASRHISCGKDEPVITAFGKDKVISAGDNYFSISDSAGNNKEYSYQDTTVNCLTKSLENFALSITSPEENKLCSSAGENLANMAVIESAYLSARTAVPEEPSRILKIEHAEMKY